MTDSLFIILNYQFTILNSQFSIHNYFIALRVRISFRQW